MLIAHVLRDKGAAVHTLAADATLEQAAKELHSRKVGALVVLDAAGAILGVLSERDLVREIARRGAAALDDTVERYANVARITLDAITTFADDVRAGRQIRGAAPRR